MARLVRYVPKRRGMAAITKSSEMDAMLEDRAQRVATAAAAVYASEGIAVPVEVVQAGSDTPQRARVAVIARHPTALRIEAKRRILGGSLDAARG